MDANNFDAIAVSLSRRNLSRTILGGLAALLVPGRVSAKRRGKPGKAGADKDRDRNGRRGKRENRNRGNESGDGPRRNARQDRVARTEATPSRCYTGSPCIPGPNKNLSKCDLEDSAGLRNKNCSGCNLSQANLRKANASGANLARANLNHACLVDTNLTRADLTGTSTKGAVFCRTRMPGGAPNDSGCDKPTDCCPTCVAIGDACSAGGAGGCCNGGACLNGRCACPPSKPNLCNGACQRCCAANHCAAGEVCCGGQCVSGDCCASDRCPAALAPICREHRCVACQSGEECATARKGSICCSGACLQGTCCEAADCPSARAPDCIGNQCVCAGDGNRQCRAGETCCPAGCSDLGDDPANCRECGTNCPPDRPLCAAGACVACRGTADCAVRTCETVNCTAQGTCAYEPARDGDDCEVEAGAGVCCGGACAVGDACCDAGQCAPPAPICSDGQCVACLANGDCPEKVCESAMCAAGACGYGLVSPGEPGPRCTATGEFCCHGDCCTEGKVCYQSACCTPSGVCPHDFCGMVPDGCGGQIQCTCGAGTGLTCCGTTCVDTSTSAAHCGACGSPCADDESCRGGVCGVTCGDGFCPAGSENPVCCDGDCTNTGTDPSNCGGCGEICGLQQVCSSAECACPCPNLACFLTKWGTPGSGSGEFNLPSGVAVAPNGTVYLADYHNHRIQFFEADGTFLGEWGSAGAGPGEFHAAISVAVASDGTVYAGDNALSDRVQRFTPDGTWQGEWGGCCDGPGKFNHVVGLEVAPSGSPRHGRVYAAGYYDSRVQFFDSDGTLRGMLGSGPGSGAGELSQPVSIGIARDGTVYVAEASTHRVSYFTADGDYLGQWGGLDFNRTPGKFIGPSGVAVAADGTVYVASLENRVQLFTPNGTYRGEFGSSGSGDGQFINAGDLALAADDRTLYVLDTSNNRVQAFCVTPP